MRRFFPVLFVFLLTFSTAAVAQRPAGGGQTRQMAQGVVKGLVVDEAGEPVISATVSVWNEADSSLVTGAITDLDGQFSISGLRPGAYYVRVSFVGYETKTVSDVTLRSGAMQADLGTIRLTEDTTLLDEVEVAAERPAVELAIDRTIYNVEDQVVAQSGSATDLLETVPSIEVDADGNISLRGNQNVAVLINGKPAPVSGEFLASFLRQLPGATIERIEVIPNPSAKYEPDGMSGIINIVLKESTDLGLSGGVNLGGDTQGGASTSANVTYGKGKWTLNANYGLRYNVRNPQGDTYRLRTPSDSSGASILLQEDSGDDKGLSHVLSTTAAYQINRQSEVSASALVSVRGEDERNVNATLMTTPEAEFLRRYDRISEEEGSGLSMDYRLGFRRVIESSRHEFSAEARYDYSENDGDELYTQQYLDASGGLLNETPRLERTEEQRREHEFDLQADYMRPVGENGRFEAGYKGSLELLDNSLYADSLDYAQDRYVPRADLNNTFDYQEMVNAAYLIYGHDFGQIATQVGVRAEQAQTTFDLLDTGESYDNDYFSLFPSAFLTYSPVDGRQFKVSYSRRIDRPRTWSLNPFRSIEDQFNVRVGNPYLRPEYTNAFEVGYTQFTGRTSFTLTPFYRYSTDVVRRYQSEPDSNGVVTTRPENFATSESYGVEAIGTARFGDVNLMLSVNGNRVVTDGSNVGGNLSNDAFQWGGRGNVSWSIRPGLDLQVFAFYRAPTRTEQGRMGAFSMTHMSLRQRFLGDRASLSLGVRDVLNASGFHFETTSPTLYQESTRRWGGREASLTFTYTFGRQDRNRNERQPQPREDENGEMNEFGID